MLLKTLKQLKRDPMNRQQLVMLSFLIMIAGMLIMMGSDGANMIFFLGLGMVFASFFGWITAMMWKIAGGIDKELGKHLE